MSGLPAGNASRRRRERERLCDTRICIYVDNFVDDVMNEALV